MLDIPVEAMHELDACRSQPDHPRPTPDCARFVATPVVIAELRRIAEETRKIAQKAGDAIVKYAYSNIADLLDERADELDRRVE